MKAINENSETSLTLPNSISEDSATTFKSKAIEQSTKQTNEIFLLTCQAAKYSEFICRTINSQPSTIPKQVNWHLVNSCSVFEDYLIETVNSEVLKDSFSIRDECTLNIGDFKGAYQSELEIMRYLRRLRYQHSCAIAVLELNNQLDIEESIARISVLAEILIKLAYVWSFSTLKLKSGYPVGTLSIDGKEQIQNMLILAMGKFGGFELNFSSDIDLIFFFGEDGLTQGARRQVENSRFFQKVGVLLIKLLDETTQDGFVFRIDMRLRPYGDSGPLAMSLEQAEDYYQEQGRDWERFAMVRSRVISGRQEEITRLEKVIRPFSFRRYIDYGVIESLRSMKEMIQREVRRRDLKNNIKLGAGGIREIEFMVQSLQLIQGGRNKNLQEKSVLKVLPFLVEDKLLQQSVAIELAQNYRFLRRVENYLQEFNEKQTQELPNDEYYQTCLYQLMKFDSYPHFIQHLNNRQLNTSEHFSQVFNDGQNEANQEADDFYLSLWEGVIDDELLAERMRLERVGSPECETMEFSQGEINQQIKKFRLSKVRSTLSSKGSKRLTAIMPLILELVLSSSSPLQSLNRLINILKSILNRTAYLDLLVENKPVLKHLVELVSQSSWIADRLTEHPILMDELLYPKSLYQPLKIVDLKNELRQSLLRIEDDEEVLLNSIRQFKQINELRVASALLIGQLNISEVGEYLTELAEVIIESSVIQCWKSVTERYGAPENLTAKNGYGFAIIGYGKLGGTELGFNSDLDLVFLFDQSVDANTNGPKPISSTRFYTRLSQKLIHFLSTRTSQGVLYEVDMRLRPSGNSGMLVSHIDTFSTYQREEAWTWEHQALIRARCVFSGSETLSNQFSKLRNELINKERNRIDLSKDVVSMRDRMRKQLDQSKDDCFDLKQGVGGLVDVEFLAQFFTLNNESKNNSEVPSNTVSLIVHLRKSKKISDSTQTILTNAYNDLSNIINIRALDNRDGVFKLESSGKKQTIQTEILRNRNLVNQIWMSVFN